VLTTLVNARTRVPRYEKLGRWKEALQGYDRRLQESEALAAAGGDHYGHQQYYQQQYHSHQQYQQHHHHYGGYADDGYYGSPGGGGGGAEQAVNGGLMTPMDMMADSSMANTPEDAAVLELRIGKLRCLDALGEWQQLIDLARETWPSLASGDQVGR
jgi:hypothetical protein